MSAVEPEIPRVCPPFPEGLPGQIRHTRLGLRLLAGLPALLASVGVLAVVVASLGDQPEPLHKRYINEAARFFEAGDYEAARVGFERVAEEVGVGPEVRYNLAVCLDAQGEHDRARRLLDELAPDDHPGFARAHAWKARRLMDAPDGSPARTRDAEAHLLYALKDAPGSIEVNALLGRFYMTTGRADRAIPYLKKAAPQRPELILTLAYALRAVGEHLEARAQAWRGREVFQERAEANLDDHDARLRWAEADAILELYPEAVQVLRRETALGVDPRYPAALARIYLAWADQPGPADRPDLARRLALLEQGLAFDPANAALLSRFSALIHAGGAEGDRALAALRDLAARGRASGPVRYALGLDAWEHGRLDEARLHWEQAYRIDPKNPAFVNNLACVLAAGPDSDLPRALAAIDSIVSRQPGEPRFRETRGQILARMHRWKEALPDLETALTVYPDLPTLHRTLAETYEHLGAPALATDHRRRADARPPSPRPGTPAPPGPPGTSGG